MSLLEFPRLLGGPVARSAGNLVLLQSQQDRIVSTAASHTLVFLQPCAAGSDLMLMIQANSSRVIVPRDPELIELRRERGQATADMMQLFRWASVPAGLSQITWDIQLEDGRSSTATINAYSYYEIAGGEYAGDIGFSDASGGLYSARTHDTNEVGLTVAGNCFLAGHNRRHASGTPTFNPDYSNTRDFQNSTHHWGFFTSGRTGDTIPFSITSSRRQVANAFAFIEAGPAPSDQKLKFGALDIDDVKRGSTQVDKLLMGSTQVWPAT